MRIIALLHFGVILAITLQLNPASGSEQDSKSVAFGKVIRLDPRIDKLVPEDALLEKVADGFSWVEGPVWDKKRGYLLFSDIPDNSIFRWEEGEGIALFLRPSGYTGISPFGAKSQALMD